LAASGLVMALFLARRAPRPWVAICLLIGSVAASCGWWFLRNLQLYGEAIPSSVIAAAKEGAGGNTLYVASKHGVNLFTISFLTDFWDSTLKSFVASFNWQTVFLDSIWYALYAILGLVGLSGLFLGVLRGYGAPRARMTILFGAVIVGGTVLSTMAINVYGEWSPQGRYLFPALVPMALGGVVGWHWLGRQLRFRRAVPVAACGSLVLVNGVSLFAYAVPSYYGTNPPRIVLQIDQPREAATVQDSANIVGWALAEGVSHWHLFTTESVARYRMPVDEVAIYSDGPAGARRLVARADYRLSRPDVGDYFGKSANLVNVGYRADIPVRDILSGSVLYICASARTVAAPHCVERTIHVNSSTKR